MENGVLSAHLGLLFKENPISDQQVSSYRRLKLNTQVKCFLYQLYFVNHYKSLRRILLNPRNLNSIYLINENKEKLFFLKKMLNIIFSILVNPNVASFGINRYRI